MRSQIATLCCLPKGVSGALEIEEKSRNGVMNDELQPVPKCMRLKQMLPFDSLERGMPHLHQL